MRQVTATEKYRAVNEGKMAKGEFVRQMRMAYPSVISQWNSYNDTVSILKNRGFISEKTGVESYDSRYDLNISPDSIDRGIRYELAGQGLDPTEALANRDEMKLKNITDRVVKNLKKDPLHYINLLAKESSHVDKNDKEKEVKRGAGDVDTFNGMKKADLRENTESAKENIIKVASEIRAKYAKIPGFNVILKDFLQTHQDDIKAGRVTDPIAEFDNYIDANYDRLDEKDGAHSQQSDDEFLNHIQNLHQANQKRPKGKKAKAEEVNEISPEAADAVAFLATGAGIKGASHVAGKLLAALEAGRFGEKGKALAQDIHNLAKEEVAEGEVNETYGPDMAQIFSIIEDRARDTGADVQIEAEEVMEAIGQEYGIDFEFGAGESRQQEAKGKDHDGDGDIDSDDYMMAKDKAIKKAMGKDEVVRESIKNIITKVLEEQMINEAATNELARLADEYAGFEGMKSAILDLQNIVTDIESYYDKTREKIQKAYDSIGEIRNEEGLKVGGFLAPTIESAFNKDLRPIAKRGFTKGLETPKVKTLSQADIDAARAAGDIEEEPKQTIFTPVNETEK